MGRRIHSKNMEEIEEKGIFNLSKVQLTQEERILLEKDLKYFPPRNFNKFQTFVDVHKFVIKFYVKIHLLPIRFEILGTFHPK